MNFKKYKKACIKNNFLVTLFIILSMLKLFFKYIFYVISFY